MAESRVFALNGVSVQLCELVSFIFDKNLSWEKSGGRFSRYFSKILSLRIDRRIFLC